jgi:hypothetical protein
MKHTLTLFTALLLADVAAPCAAGELEPKDLRRLVAAENVCAWPNLTLMRDGTVIAIIHDQPSHGGHMGVTVWQAMQKTGRPVEDPATKLIFRRLDVQAALEHVFATPPTKD